MAARIAPAESRLSMAPAKSAEFDRTWARIASSVDCIMTRKGPRLRLKVLTDLMGLDNFFRNCCTTNEAHWCRHQTNRTVVGGDLYNGLSEYFVKHLQSMSKECESLRDLDLLRYYATEWDRYTTGANGLNRLFTCFNQHWVKRERHGGMKNLYRIFTLALVQWRAHFFAPIQKNNARLTNAVIRLITQQRNGEFIDLDQDVVKTVVLSFVSLGIDTSDPDKECLDVYNDQFEYAFLRATENYYKVESDAFLAEKSISHYLRKVEERLREEEARVERYLHSKTRKSLVNKCIHILIREHSELMWEHFNFQLDFGKDEDLQLMYYLLSRIPEGLGLLRKWFEEYVKNAGVSSIQKLVGEGGANTESIDPKTYVNALLEVHQRNSETVRKNFKGEAGVAASLDKACREFVNRNAGTGASQTKSSELIAKHVDMLLRGSKVVGEDDIDGALNNVMILFKYLEDKDVFQAFYTTKLSKRLILGLSASDEREANMISKLKEACGFEYGNKLQRMFTDTRLSKDLTDSFKEYMWENDANMDFNFSIMVLGSNFWPLCPPSHGFVIPRQIEPTYNQFQIFYQRKHSGRKITWLWNYSKNELRTNYLGEKYILVTSSFQAAVLLQYNRHDSLSLDELVLATAIPKDRLTQVMLSLVKAKLLMIKEQEQYDLNTRFRSKKTRVNLNLPIMVETSNVLKTVDEHRKYVTQATIVRIMKSRKTMRNQALIQEVISQTSQRFVPKIPDIKQAIETLLEKEYIERVKGSRDTFTYVN